MTVQMVKLADSGGIVPGRAASNGKVIAKTLDYKGHCSILRYIFSEPLRGVMATTKTATLAFRIDPGLKAALRAAAYHEPRSIANMVEVLIRDYCGRNGIAIPEQDDLFDDSRKPAESRR